MSLLGNLAAAIFILSLLYTAIRNEHAQSYTKGVVNKIYGDEQEKLTGAQADRFTLETVDLSHLAKHDLSPEFLYSRRIVNTRYVSGERKMLTTINESIFKQSQKIPNQDLHAVQRRQDLPITLEVSIAKSLQHANTLSFAMATPIERLLDSLPSIMHWLPNTGAMLHVIAPVDPRKEEVTEHMRNLGINITIVESNDRFPINYFSLVALLYHTRTPATKWLALIDDDTFFPDLGNLLAHLEERYNHKLPQIITGVSDDIVQVRKLGMMPFGGGGIFLSVPFAAMIVDNNYPGTAGAVKGGEYPTPPWPEYSPFGSSDPAEAIDPARNWIMNPKSPYRHSFAFQRCLQTDKLEGDQILNDCINKETPVRPQYDIGFHQMDLHGDISGFFESGRRSLTLHHWKTWFKVDVPSGAAVTKICGKNCYLQRFRFQGLDASRQQSPDETWVLNNGYSIAKYPNGVKGLSQDLPKPDRTTSLAVERPNDVSSPPPPAYLPDPHKNPIAANPRFMRLSGGWIEWPNLWLGEEVFYEGVLGFIVDKEMHVGGYALPNKQADPYQGYGNLIWIPANEAFKLPGTGDESGEVQVLADGGGLKKSDDGANEKAAPESQPAEAKVEETQTKEAKAEDKESPSKKEDKPSKETSTKEPDVRGTREDADAKTAEKSPGTITHKIAIEETSHFQRLNKRDDDPDALPADWVPLKGSPSSSGGVTPDSAHKPHGEPGKSGTESAEEVTESDQLGNTSPPTVLPGDPTRSDEDIEDERRFWSGMEKTWGGGADRFEHALGPLRRPLKKGEEVIRYMLVEAVGGWGNPNQQKVEHVKEALQPDKYIVGYPGDPAKKLQQIQHGGYLIWNGDPGFEGLWGPDPEPKPEGQAPKEKRAADPELVGGGNVFAARTPEDKKREIIKKSWFGGGSKPHKLEGGGLGGVDRPPVDWVRQTYVRRRWHPPANPSWPHTDQHVDGNWEKLEDEVIELIWMR